VGKVVTGATLPTISSQSTGPISESGGNEIASAGVKGTMKQALLRQRTVRALVIAVSINVAMWLLIGKAISLNPLKNWGSPTTVLQPITQTSAIIARVTLRNSGGPQQFPQFFRLPQTQIKQGLLVSALPPEKFPLAVTAQVRSIGPTELQSLTEELVAGGFVGPEVDFGLADGSASVKDQTALTSNLAFELGGLTYR
jgi:hypothetical protein